jgi:hypothetical protein
MNPLYMRDSVLTIDGTDHAAQCSSIVFTPSSSPQIWKGLKPTSQFTAAGAATWTLDVTAAQDWDDADSFSIYLHEHEGETIAVTAEPKDGGASFAANVTIVPGAIGGAVDAFAEGTVSMPCTKPVRTPAV